MNKTNVSSYHLTCRRLLIESIIASVQSRIAAPVRGSEASAKLYVIADTLKHSGKNDLPQAVYICVPVLCASGGHLVRMD